MLKTCEVLINNVIFINMKLKAIWPSGKAVDCKSSIPSSNLGVALRGYGGMVDTTDLKSVDQLVVRVQVPLPPMNI